MTEQIVRLTVGFKVNEGQLAEFKGIAQQMTMASAAEPGTLGYEWFSSADESQFKLLETYSDAAAVEVHFAGPAVNEWVPKLLAFCSVDEFEVYGDPGAKVTQSAGGMGAVFFKYEDGIGR
jgi:quinol monooxygenase YgiN